jgi:hypothetical protein
VNDIIFRDENYIKAGRLAALLHLARLNHEQARRAEDLTSQIDLNLFRQEVARTSAWVWTAKQAKSLELARLCDPRWLADLEQHDAKAASKQKWIDRLVNEFNSLEIRLIPLKGGLLGPVIYGDSGYKKMNDFDFLVEFKDAIRAVEAIKKLGFVSMGEKIGKREVSPKSHHSPPFFSPDLTCVLGVHWNLCQLRSGYQIDRDELWRNTHEINLGSGKAYRMDWEYHLAHLCVHLPFYKIGVRELADVYNLILFAEPALDLEKFAAIINRWQAAGPAYRVLTLAAAAVATDVPGFVPAKFLDEFKLAADDHWVEDTDKRAALGSALVWTRSVHIGKIEKLFSVSIMSRKFPERINSWKESWRHALYPDYEEVEKFLLVPPEASAMRTLGARLKFPQACLGEMIRDHGAKEFMLLTLWNLGQIGLWSLREPLGLNPKSAAEDDLAVKLINQLE